jgi:hypothetical protein
MLPVAAVRVPATTASCSVKVWLAATNTVAAQNRNAAHAVFKAVRKESIKKCRHRRPPWREIENIIETNSSVGRYSSNAKVMDAADGRWREEWLADWQRWAVFV